MRLFSRGKNKTQRCVMSAAQVVIGGQSDWAKNLLVLAVIAILVMVVLWPTCGDPEKVSQELFRDTVVEYVAAPADTIVMRDTLSITSVDSVLVVDSTALSALHEQLRALERELSSTKLQLSSSCDTIVGVADSLHVSYSWPPGAFTIRYHPAPIPVRTIRSVTLVQNKPSAWTDNIVVAAGLGYGLTSVQGQVFNGGFAGIVVGYRLW